MMRFHKALIVVFVASLGLWGCTQGPANGSASVERIRALESKTAKLEDDYRAAATARDQFRKKLAEADARHAQQAEQLQALNKEKEDLQQQLAGRTNERNALQAQYEQFRNSLKDLLGRAEASLNPPTEPAVTTVAAPPQDAAETAPQ